MERIILSPRGNMNKNDMTLDDINQVILELGAIVDKKFDGIDKQFVSVEKQFISFRQELNKQGVLLEDLNSKFDKNIDLLTEQMDVKKKVDDHEARINDFESDQKTLKMVVKLHSDNWPSPSNT